MMIKKQEGITIISLVITIVVILIIAGSTLGMIFDEEGMLKSSQESKELQENYSNREETKTNELINDADKLMKEKPEIGKLVSKEIKYKEYTDSTSDVPVPIPGGYCVVKDSVADKNNKNTIASGLVISDLANDTLDNELINGKRGNQFVWVPVNDTQFNRMYDSTNKRGNLYDFTNIDSTTNLPTLITYSETEFREPDIITDYDGANAVTNAKYFKDAISQTMTGAEFKTQLEREFDEMIKSVQKYKGFYIGRYETGNLSSTDNTVKAVIQKGATVGKANWYYQYQEIKNIAKDNNNVTTSMIWGCQYDRTLEWIAQTNEGGYGLLTNSKTWGNYSDSEGNAATNRGSIQLSGTNSAWKKNHIYDLAGNAHEWTIEANDTKYRTRRRR